MKHILITLLLLCSSVAYGYDATIVVRNQITFDRMEEAIREVALRGKKNILVKIKCGNYLFHEDHLMLKGLPSDISVTLKGTRVKVFPEGKNLQVGNYTKNTYVYYQGKKRKIVNNWTEVKQCDQLIEVIDNTSKFCRLKMVDGDVAFKGDIIQFSQWYLTYKYVVTDCKNGYVFFIANNLKRCDGGRSWSVNYDYVYGKELPRYRIWQTSNSTDRIYEGTAMRFVNVRNVSLKSLTIEGLIFCGNAYLSSGALIQINGVKAEVISIRNCQFDNCHSNCILLGSTANVTVTGCQFRNNYTTTIYSGGSCENVHIVDCLFDNNSLGWNNTFCINIKGKNFIVARNKFRDFAYGALGIGEHMGDNKVWVSGVIEDNEIFYTSQYYADYKKHTLMDSGAIYLWTQNDDVTIRNNYIHDYIGAKDNRGIFCDDGAANFKIIGNRILRIANSYCIDSRRIKEQHPERFTNNVNISITDNTVDGGIRFEGRDEVGNKCVYGNNTIIMVDGDEPPVMKISNVKIVKKDIMSRR